MKPCHPGEFLRTEILDELGLSIAKAAGILGVPRAALSDLVNETSGMSLDMARRVEKAFGVSGHMLLRMQSWHDEVQRTADG